MALAPGAAVGQIRGWPRDPVSCMGFLPCQEVGKVSAGSDHVLFSYTGHFPKSALRPNQQVRAGTCL